MTFKEWWYELGSGLATRPGDDYETHAQRVAEMAWKMADSVKTIESQKALRLCLEHFEREIADDQTMIDSDFGEAYKAVIACLKPSSSGGNGAMTSSDAQPETSIQKAVREFYTSRGICVGWGRDKQGKFLAQYARDAEEAWRQAAFWERNRREGCDDENL